MGLNAPTFALKAPLLAPNFRPAGEKAPNETEKAPDPPKPPIFHFLLHFYYQIFDRSGKFRKKNEKRDGRRRIYKCSNVAGTLNWLAWHRIFTVQYNSDIKLALKTAKLLDFGPKFAEIYKISSF